MLNQESLNSLDREALLQLKELNEAGMLDDYLNESTKAEPTLAELLSYDSKGNIIQSNENCQLVLQHDDLLKGAIRLNEFTGSRDIVKEMPWKRFGAAFADNDLDNIIIYFERKYGLKVDKQIERAIKVVAAENSYHPIRDLLNSLQWDGEERISKVLTKYLGVEPTPLAIESLKLFMLGAISRVFKPGCKFEYMLCLVGGQGAGKSTFLRFLALKDEWFTDDLKKLSDKDIHEHLNGHWIIEIPEMVALLHTKFVEETKSFISRQSDNYRIPYDKFSADHKRQCVFAGTSNRIEFLPDDKSGNRRFLPIKVNAEKAEVHLLEDEEESREYFKQLWAEVMEIFRSGNFKLTLSKEMQEVLYAEQERYLPEDLEENDIINFINDKKPKYLCRRMIYVEALGFSNPENLENWRATKIGDIINTKFKDEYRAIGLHDFPKYGKQRGWIRIDDGKESDFEAVQEDMDNPFID